MRVADDGGNRRPRAVSFSWRGPQDRFEAAGGGGQDQGSMKWCGHPGVHVTTERRSGTNCAGLPKKTKLFGRFLRFPLRFLMRDATLCWLDLECPLPGEQWNNTRPNAEM